VKHTKRKKYLATDDLSGRELLAEYRPEGRWTLRPGDVVTMDTVRAKGPSGRYKKLTGPIHQIYRQPNGTVAVDVIDPLTRHVRTCYAEACTKKKRKG